MTLKKKKTLWIEEGRKCIDESKWLEWELYVIEWARGRHVLIDLETVLKCLTMIYNWESWENVQNVVDEYRIQGGAPNLLIGAIEFFSKKWEEAKKKLKVSK